MIAQISTLFRYRPLIQQPGLARAQGPLPRQRAGLRVELRQPAAAAARPTASSSRYMLPVRRSPDMEPYFLFLFCGILPWTWFQSSVLEASGVLIAGGQPDQEGAVPGRGAAGRHRAHQPRPLRCSACRSCWLFLLCHGRLDARRCCCCRCRSLVQLVLTLGLALFVSALTVHFRDIQNILGHCCTCGSSPRRSSTSTARRRRPAHAAAAPQPHDPRGGELPADALRRPLRPLARAWARPPCVALGALRLRRLPLRPAARHPGGGGVRPPAPCGRASDADQGLPALPPPEPVPHPEERLLTGSLLSDLTPDADLHRPRRRVASRCRRAPPSGSSARTAPASRRC